MQVVYSPLYNVDIGEHIFPTIKYRLIHDSLIKKDILKKEDFVTPEIAKDSDILLAHTKEYLNKMKKGYFTPQELLTLELPFSVSVFKASLLCAGGTIFTCSLCLKQGIGIHIGGGFHHAFSDHGEGFCLINDIAVGILRCKKDGLLQKALIIDCDLHQGNGTAQIFSKYEDVFTFSIHQESNYPLFKPPSNLDIGLSDGADDEEYLSALKTHIPDIIDKFKPELILYVAGADPYKDDQLGGLALSKEGLKQRDGFIFTLAKDKDIPLAVVLGGGYARNISDTVEIHCNTIESAIKMHRA